MSVEFDELTATVTQRIALINEERKAMYARLPCEKPMDAVINRIDAQDEQIHMLLHRIQALEEIVTAPDGDIGA